MDDHFSYFVIFGPFGSCLRKKVICMCCSRRHFLFIFKPLIDFRVKIRKKSLVIFTRVSCWWWFNLLFCCVGQKIHQRAITIELLAAMSSISTTCQRVQLSTQCCSALLPTRFQPILGSTQQEQVFMAHYWTNWKPPQIVISSKNLSEPRLHVVLVKECVCFSSPLLTASH